MSDDPGTGSGDVHTTLASLLSDASTVFYTVELGRSDFDDLRLHLVDEADGAAVVVLRGWKCKRTEDFFDEVASALQFPWYFGENWDAFEEAIGDLSWLPADGYVLMVNDAGELLSEAPGELRTLLDILGAASSDESPCKVVLGLGERGGDAAERFAKSGAQLVPLGR
ncbi:MAG TPA: barstar family protein [Acidimicrobiales bacterium]|nr:barstar family protein [Acidimicrobiales bacterium]